MGNPFVHIDLSTGDVAKAKKFYKSIFDWAFTDFPNMAWAGITTGAGGIGGGMGKKEQSGQPTAWTPYVQVDDVKKTIAKAKKAGATILVPYAEVGEMGVLGVFIDPQGAQLGVWQQLAPKAPPKRKTAAKPKKKAAAKKKPR